MWEMIYKAFDPASSGWEVSWVLAVLSVVGLALIFWRGYHIWWLPRCVRPGQRELFLDQARESVEEGDPEKALDMAMSHPWPVVREIAAWVEKTGGSSSPSETRRKLEDKIDRDIMPRLRRGLSSLSTVAKVAPMLGLFGTVWGMMGAFQKIAAKAGSGGGVNPNELADNIAVALVTTFLGLMIAIPVMWVINSLQERLGEIDVFLQEYADLTQLIARKRQGQHVS